MKKVFSYLWQLPQNLCGLFYRSVSKANKLAEVESVGAKVYLQRHSGGVTLGKYIFICQDYKNKDIIIKHECGHVKQSKILGPLYLIVIGIPSIIHDWLSDCIGCCKRHKEGYYHFYTEHILMGEFDIRNK